MNYSESSNSAGATFRVQAGDQYVDGTTVATGSSWTNYDSLDVGPLTISQAGPVTISVTPLTKPHNAVMNLRDVTLVTTNGDDNLPYEYVWSNAPAGTFVLTAQATDDDGATTVSDPVTIEVTKIGTVILPSSQAVIHGATANYDPVGDDICDWTNVNDWVSWTATVQTNGTFQVWVNYSAPSNSAAATYRVEAGDQRVHGTVAGTGNDWLTYQSVYLGTVNIPQAGPVTVNVIPETKPNGAVMNLRDVTLVP